jgi:hypothetical protein
VVVGSTKITTASAVCIERSSEIQPAKTIMSGVW